VICVNRRFALLIVVALSVLVTETAGARSADSRLIQVSASFQRLGAFRISDDPTYAAATRALGPSSSCHVVGNSPSHVVAAWRPLGVSIDLLTYGGIPSGKTGCTAPGLIRVSTVRVTARSWTTSLGLRVGDRVTKLKRLYRRATATNGLHDWYGAGYWLVTRRGTCLGVCNQRTVTAPVLVAEASGGRVRALVFVVGAQGE
jgi:hypothetical protein